MLMGPSQPGHANRSLGLLTRSAIKLGVVESTSRETVRRKEPDWHSRNAEPTQDRRQTA